MQGLILLKYMEWSFIEVHGYDGHLGKNDRGKEVLYNQSRSLSHLA